MNRSRWLQAVFLLVRFGRLDQRDLSRDSFEFMEYTWPMCHHISVTIFFATFWSFITYLLSTNIGVLCKSKFGFFLFSFWAGKDYILCRGVTDKQKIFPKKRWQCLEYILYLKEWITKLCKKIFPRREDKGVPKKVTNRIDEVEYLPSHRFRVLRNQFFLPKWPDVRENN